MSEHPVTPSYAFDPEVAALAALSVSPPPTSAVEARARTAEVLATLSIEVDVSDLDVDDREIPGPPGDPDVTVRVYSPKVRAADAVPAILYIHGGGFYAGSIDTEHGGAARIAARNSASSWCRSSTASHPSTRSRPDSRTATRRCSGSTRRPATLGVDPARVR